VSFSRAHCSLPLPLNIAHCTYIGTLHLALPLRACVSSIVTSSDSGNERRIFPLLLHLCSACFELLCSAPSLPLPLSLSLPPYCSVLVPLQLLVWCLTAEGASYCSVLRTATWRCRSPTPHPLPERGRGWILLPRGFPHVDRAGGQAKVSCCARAARGARRAARGAVTGMSSRCAQEMVPTHHDFAVYRKLSKYSPPYLHLSSHRSTYRGTKRRGARCAARGARRARKMGLTGILARRSIAKSLSRSAARKISVARPDLPRRAF
jgi:hypothetical protein